MALERRRKVAGRPGKSNEQATRIALKAKAR
jgi:hypothetical protein